MFNRWQAQSLQLRMLLLIIASIALVVATVTAVSVSAARERLAEDLLASGRDYARILGHTSSVYLAQQDSHQLLLTAKAAAEGGQAEFVAFYSPSGDLMAAAASPDARRTARVPFDGLIAAPADGEIVSRWSGE